MGIERVHKMYSFTQIDESIDRSRYPSPQEVVTASLEEIQEDGSVWEYDAEEKLWLRIEPYNRKYLEKLSPYQYAEQLFELREAIAGTVMSIARNPIDVEQHVQHLAYRLTAYRHDLTFIGLATSLLSIDPKHGWLNFEFPEGEPAEWVPRLK